jgi:hypothetical protein
MRTRGVGRARGRLRGRRGLGARPGLLRRTSAMAQVQDPQRLGVGDAGRAQAVLDLEPLERGLRAGAEEPVHGAAGVAERLQDPLQRPHLERAGRSSESGTERHGTSARPRRGRGDPIARWEWSLDRSAVPPGGRKRLDLEARGRAGRLDLRMCR